MYFEGLHGMGRVLMSTCDIALVFITHTHLQYEHKVKFTI